MQNAQATTHANQIDRREIAHLRMSLMSFDDMAAFIPSLQKMIDADQLPEGDLETQAHTLIDLLSEHQVAAMLPALAQFVDPHQLTRRQLNELHEDEQLFESLTNQAMAHADLYVNDLLESVDDVRQLPLIAAGIQATLGEPVAREYRTAVRPIRFMSLWNRQNVTLRLVQHLEEFVYNAALNPKRSNTPEEQDDLNDADPRARQLVDRACEGHSPSVTLARLSAIENALLFEWYDSRYVETLAPFHSANGVEAEAMLNYIDAKRSRLILEHVSEMREACNVA